MKGERLYLAVYQLPPPSSQTVDNFQGLQHSFDASESKKHLELKRHFFLNDLRENDGQHGPQESPSSAHDRTSDPGLGHMLTWPGDKP